MAAKLKKNHFVIHPDGLFRFRIAVIMRVDRYKSFTLGISRRIVSG